MIIPARAGSSRFPRKPLAMVRGHSLLERVWRIAKDSSLSARIVVATESEEVVKTAEEFGAEAVLSSETCATGSDRAFQVALKLDPKVELVVCLQGDAVLTPPWVIESTVSQLLNDPTIEIATPAIHLEGAAKDDFLAIKKGGSSTGTTVVFNQNRDAMYFSKGVIPHARSGDHSHIYRHIGMYAYRADALRKFASFSQGELEKVEGLEQLRALENGMKIRVVEVDYRGRTHASIDNPEDIAIVEAIIEREGELVRW